MKAIYRLCLLANLTGGLFGCMTGAAASDPGGEISVEAVPAKDARAAVQPSAPASGISVPAQGNLVDLTPDKTLRLNFRGVPLELVLNYMSEAAGFVIVLETEVKGKVDAWSDQPLNREEAVGLLNGVLSRNGYAAIRNGRTLTIVNRDAARRKDIPVKSGSI